jgi:hypothetical protein
VEPKVLVTTFDSKILNQSLYIIFMSSDGC